MAFIGLGLGIKGAKDLAEMTAMEIRERNCELTEPYDVMHHLGIKRVNGAYQDYQLKYYLDFLDSKKPLTKEEIYHYTNKYQNFIKKDKIKQQNKQLSEYDKMVQMWNSKKRNGAYKKNVWTISHWLHLSTFEHQNRLDRLYNETILGEMCEKKPVLRQRNNVRTEYWIFNKQPLSMFKRKYYDVCCRKIGYDA